MTESTQCQHGLHREAKLKPKAKPNQTKLKISTATTTTTKNLILERKVLFITRVLTIFLAIL